MQKATILVALALMIAGGVYVLRYEFSRDSLPKSSPIRQLSADNPQTGKSQETQSEEAIWQKLGDRLVGRMASVNTDETEPDSSPEESEPVFDTRADLLAAAGVTPEEEAEALRWAFERGFETHSLGYEFYDRETLKALADAGDIFALQRLADHAAWSEGQLEKAAVLYREAAVRGSVVAVDRLVGNEMAKAKAANNSDQRNSTKRHFFNALAWTEVLRRRVGDMPLPGMQQEYILGQLKQFDITLSEADFNSIDAQAQRFFRDLTQTRAELGFEEFDNASPILFEKLKRHGLENAAIKNP